MHPTRFDLTKRQEQLRLLVEVRGFLRVCLREHHGTDFSGRTYAVAALDEWLDKLTSQIDVLPLPELVNLIPPTTVLNRLQKCPECAAYAHVDPPCTRCHGSGLVLLDVGQRPAQRFRIPHGSQCSRCRGCGASVYWIETDSRKRMPVDPDGVSHFATCPKAGLFRRQRQLGVAS